VQLPLGRDVSQLDPNRWRCACTRSTDSATRPGSEAPTWRGSTLSSRARATCSRRYRTMSGSMSRASTLPRDPTPRDRRGSSSRCPLRCRRPSSRARSAWRSSPARAPANCHDPGRRTAGSSARSKRCSYAGGLAGGGAFAAHPIARSGAATRKVIFTGAASNPPSRGEAATPPCPNGFRSAKGRMGPSMQGRSATTVADAGEIVGIVGNPTNLGSPVLSLSRAVWTAASRVVTTTRPGMATRGEQKGCLFGVCGAAPRPWPVETPPSCTLYRTYLRQPRTKP
jgi:hypothetical protein